MIELGELYTVRLEAWVTERKPLVIERLIRAQSRAAAVAEAVERTWREMGGEVRLTITSVAKGA